jgi:hypothetical protein
LNIYERYLIRIKCWTTWSVSVFEIAISNGSNQVGCIPLYT